MNWIFGTLAVATVASTLSMAHAQSGKAPPLPDGGKVCLHSDKAGDCDTIDYISYCFIQVDGVKYLDHKICNVVTGSPSSGYGTIDIGAPVANKYRYYNSKFQVDIRYEVSANGEQKNYTATWNGELGPDGKIYNISHGTITLGPVQELYDDKEGLCYVNPRAKICFLAG